MPAGRPNLYETAEEMQRLIDLYFLTCKIHQKGDFELVPDDEESQLIISGIPDVNPTISGLAYTLGMTTESLRNYGTKEEFSATVKRAKQRVEQHLEGHLYGNSVAGAIFNLKNNFGWKDKTEQEVQMSGSTTLTDEQLELIATRRGKGTS